MTKKRKTAKKGVCKKWAKKKDPGGKRRCVKRAKR
jgi:hypothetical protein